MKFRKKPVVVEAITFEEFIQHGRDNGANIVGGMPWSWTYNGHPISHENDQRYLIPTKEGTMNMTPDDMLITGVQGEIYPCKKDIFEATYEPVLDDKPKASEAMLDRSRASDEQLRAMALDYAARHYVHKDPVLSCAEAYYQFLKGAA